MKLVPKLLSFGAMGLLCGAAMLSAAGRPQADSMVLSPAELRAVTGTGGCDGYFTKMSGVQCGDHEVQPCYDAWGGDCKSHPCASYCTLLPPDRMDVSRDTPNAILFRGVIGTPPCGLMGSQYIMRVCTEGLIYGCNCDGQPAGNPHPCMTITGWESVGC
jgi:hypothetical protein